MAKLSLNDLKNFRGQTVFVRVDYNVPLDEAVTDGASADVADGDDDRGVAPDVGPPGLRCNVAVAPLPELSVIVSSGAEVSPLPGLTIW